MTAGTNYFENCLILFVDVYFQISGIKLILLSVESKNISGECKQNTLWIIQDTKPVKVRAYLPGKLMSHQFLFTYNCKNKNLFSNVKSPPPSLKLINKKTETSIQFIW